MTPLAIAFWSFIGAGLCAVIAGFKGRSVVGWLFIGLLSGLLGVIVISCIPSLPTSTTQRPSAMDDEVEAAAVAADAAVARMQKSLS